MANQADPLPGLNVQIEIGEHLLSVRITEADIAQGDASGIAPERLSLRMIAKGMGDQKRGERLGESRHVLRHVDKCDGQITGGVEHGNTESTDEHHLAGGDQALLPNKRKRSR